MTEIIGVRCDRGRFSVQMQSIYREVFVGIKKNI